MGAAPWNSSPDRAVPSDLGLSPSRRGDPRPSGDFRLDRHSPPAGSSRCPAAVPVRAGIGLRAPHYRDLLEGRPDIGWVEVHSENYYGRGGQPHHYLERVRERHPLSLHGVGLSLGRADGLDGEHLARLAELVERYEPGLVSDHVCWGAVGERHLNDLLPLPYTEEALARLCEHVDEAQSRLRRRILVENVSSYITYADSSIPEWEFFAAIARRTGCGLLLDVNNIHVSARNHGFDPKAYIDAIPSAAVEEFHLAGYDVAGELLIDTHAKPVYPEVWSLYRYALETVGARPTLVEWDNDLPALSNLLAEARKAQAMMDAVHEARVAAG
jgi:uncharacterized protein